MARILDNLKTERESAGHSIHRLAALANVGSQTIITLENGGTADEHVVTRIADALGVTLETLGQRVMEEA